MNSPADLNQMNQPSTFNSEAGASSHDIPTYSSPEFTLLNKPHPSDLSSGPASVQAHGDAKDDGRVTSGDASASASTSGAALAPDSYSNKPGLYPP